MPHTIKFDKLRLSFLYILIPVSIAVTISVGSLILFMIDQFHLKIESGIVFLNPVVALGYLLLSIAIIFLYLKPHTRWKIISGRVISGIVFLFSLFTLIEFFGNIETHVVSTLYSKLRDSGSFNFNELMSIETGFLFLVLGLAYSCTSYKRILNKFSVTLNAVVFFISLVAIMGYVFGVPAFYKLHRLPDFNFFSALCAFALSIAGFFTRPVGSYFMILMSKGAAGAFARRVSVACLILPPLFGKLGLYYSTEGIPNSQAYALVAILCLLAMVGVVWKSSKELEQIDRNRLGTEKERLKSIAQTDAILAKAPIGIALFGVTGDLIKANQIFYQYIIKNTEQINITKIDILKQHLHCVQNFNVAHLINSELPGKSFEIEVVEDNKSIFLNLNFFVVKSAIGEFLGLGCSFVEITHLKEIESELRNARDEANSSNKAKSQFLANM
ncbi:MAG: hypothetical protein L6Q37_06635, partial [Bdellovibrionaceae bacterium]|nr:hypothetical protein [Pseudobdellovibrionaceae bacterium]